MHILWPCCLLWASNQICGADAPYGTFVTALVWCKSAVPAQHRVRIALSEFYCQIGRRRIELLRVEVGPQVSLGTIWSGILIFFFVLRIVYLEHSQTNLHFSFSHFRRLLRKPNNEECISLNFLFPNLKKNLYLEK